MINLWHHPWVRHLRLPFNLLLSPIFLWGVWLGGGVDDAPRVIVAFLALHVFLYGGTNALNSFYDRDEGPVGGMWSPPPVDRGLLTWSWVVQALGVPLAAWVGGPFLLVWLLLFVAATAYSHPRWRWKANPWGAVATVSLGQGGLGALAGLWAVAPRMEGAATWAAAWSLLATPSALLGLLAACTLIVGLYVISQAYQTAEDRARGDQTWPVILGARRALRVATAFSAVGGVIVWARVALALGLPASLPLLLLLGSIGAVQWRWASRFDEGAVRENFRAAMTFLAVGGLGLSGYLLVLLLVR